MMSSQRRGRKAPLGHSEHHHPLGDGQPARAGAEEGTGFTEIIHDPNAPPPTDTGLQQRTEEPVAEEGPAEKIPEASALDEERRMSADKNSDEGDPGGGPP
jgi:hypothetical protein